MFKFSELAEKQLRAGGWTPDRSVDITEEEEWLTQHGYVINDTIRAVFREFCGLHFIIPRPRIPDMDINTDIDVDFDVIKSEEYTFIENIENRNYSAELAGIGKFVIFSLFID